MSHQNITEQRPRLSHSIHFNHVERLVIDTWLPNNCIHSKFEKRKKRRIRNRFIAARSSPSSSFQLKRDSNSNVGIQIGFSVSALAVDKRRTKQKKEFVLSHVPTNWWMQICSNRIWTYSICIHIAGVSSRITHGSARGDSDTIFI